MWSCAEPSIAEIDIRGIDKSVLSTAATKDDAGVPTEVRSLLAGFQLQAAY